MTNLEQARLDLLKQELNHIESSIRKIDDITSSIKNWAIVVWGGAVTILLQDPGLKLYIWVTFLLPLVFMLVDARWRKVQRSFIYRYGLIGNTVNDEGLENIINGTSGDKFRFLDPRAKKQHGDDYDTFTGVSKTVKFGTVTWLYLGLAIMSVLLALLLRYG